MYCVTTKATLYGAGNADLGLCSIGQRLLIRNDLEGVVHIPVAALGIVSELSDRVPARQALDTPCRLANFESLLEKLTDGASHGRARGRMGQSQVWITDRGIRGWARSQCEWRYTIPTLLTDPKANEVYDRLASPKRVTAELRTPVLNSWLCLWPFSRLRKNDGAT